MDEMTLVEKYNHDLYHHGVKGQKWGLRRYQNPDGSLTPAGKRRYGTKTNFERVQAAKRAAAKASSKEAIARRKADARTAAEIAKYRQKMGINDDHKSDMKSDSDPAKAQRAAALAKAREAKMAKQKEAAERTEKLERGEIPISEMTDKEINARIDRLNLEKKLKDLIEEPAPKVDDTSKKVKTGKDAIKEMFENSAKNIGQQTLTYIMGYAVNQIAKNAGHKNDTEKIKKADGTEVVVEVFRDIVNPRKGQKDK